MTEILSTSWAATYFFIPGRTQREPEAVPHSDARGDASILYEVTGFTFIFVSDELTSCMGIPGCGPENIAPPPNNPYRDLIGLDAGGQIQPLLVGDNVDPLDVTPEPSTFGVMLGAVMIIWLAHRHRRRAAR
jgi:hypothetical protein